MALWEWEFKYGGNGPDWAERIYASQCGKVNKSIVTRRKRVDGKLRRIIKTTYFSTKRPGRIKYYDSPEKVLKSLLKETL